MAISYLVGFGMNSTAEANGTSGSNPTIQSTVTRPGSTGFALKIGKSGGAGLQFRSRPAGGTLPSIFGSASCYIRIDALPDSAGQLNLMQSVGGFAVALNVNGTLTLTNPGTSSTLAFTADGLWHQIVWDITTFGSGTAASSLYVDGVLWLSDTGQTYNLDTVGSCGGIINSSSVNHAVYLSDVRFYGATTGGPVPAYFLKLSLPTAGNNAGSWTDGAGGTGDIHGSVANRPPVGVAAATAAAKIKNAVSGVTLDYVATMQSYTVAGVPAGSTINAIAAICNDGEEVSTGTKPGGIWCASNPAQSASSTSFDYGDDTATVIATYPTGWVTHLGVVAIAPSVTLGTAPTVTVRKAVASTRVVDVDFMGLYMDYTPPPIAKQFVALQAVKRANFF